MIASFIPQALQGDVDGKFRGCRRSSTAAPRAADPDVRGAWVSAAVYAAAKLGLADHLADGPRSAAELAPVTGMDATTLHRFMRTLAGFGIFTERDGQRFALTPLGDALKTGAPGSARSTLIAFGGPAFWRTWESILYSLETGKSAFEKTWGCRSSTTSPRTTRRPRTSARRWLAFTARNRRPLPRPTTSPAFRRSSMSAAPPATCWRPSCRAMPPVRGVLFDLPHVVRDAPAFLKARGVEERVTIETGSFFERVPAGGDAYLLSHIIHDWSEEQCLTILKHCREAMRPDSRLLIVETVLPEGDTPHQGKLQDLVMLVIPGRAGAHGSRVCGASHQGRLPAAPGGTDDVCRQHRGGCAGVASTTKATSARPARNPSMSGFRTPPLRTSDPSGRIPPQDRCSAPSQAAVRA